MPYAPVVTLLDCSEEISELKKTSLSAAAAAVDHHPDLSLEDLFGDSNSVISESSSSSSEEEREDNLQLKLSNLLLDRHGAPAAASLDHSEVVQLPENLLDHLFAALAHHNFSEQQQLVNTTSSNNNNSNQSRINQISNSRRSRGTPDFAGKSSLGTM